MLKFSDVSSCKSAKLHIFPKPGSQDNTIGFSMQAAKTLTYLVVPISTFFALCDHNSPTLQTDEQTERCHTRSISANMAYHVKIKVAVCIQSVTLQHNDKTTAL